MAPVGSRMEWALVPGGGAWPRLTRHLDRLPPVNPRSSPTRCTSSSATSWRRRWWRAACSWPTCRACGTRCAGPWRPASARARPACWQAARPRAAAACVTRARAAALPAHTKPSRLHPLTCRCPSASPLFPSPSSPSSAAEVRAVPGVHPRERRARRAAGRALVGGAVWILPHLQVERGGTEGRGGAAGAPRALAAARSRRRAAIAHRAYGAPLSLHRSPLALPCPACQPGRHDGLPDLPGR